MILQTFPIFLTALIALYIAFFTWRRQALEAIFFSLFSLSIVLWSSSVGLETLHETLEGKTFFSQFQYFGIAPLPVLWLLFILVFTGKQVWLKRRVIAALFLVPILSLFLVWTTKSHQLFYQTISLTRKGSMDVLEIDHGPWFWVHTAYSYLLLLLGIAILLWHLRKASSFHRKQYGILLSAAVLPLLSNGLFLAGVDFFNGIDPTPLGFGVSSLIVGFGLMRFQLFDLSPIAHQLVFNNLPMSIMILDPKNRIADLNPEAQRLFDCDPSKVIGQKPEAVIENWQALVSEYQELKKTWAELHVPIGNVKRQLEVRASVLHDARGNVLGRVIMAQDIAERKQFQEMAYHDALTGLPNRRLFDHEAENALAMASREGWTMSLLYLDLDNFKPVNDTFGHDVGDMLLKQVAIRLQFVLRSYDLFARIGGDEFIILLKRSDYERTSDICQRIIKTVSTSFLIEGRSIKIGVSIGIALYPKHSTSLETLKNYADTAMYQAKTHKAGISVYKRLPTPPPEPLRSRAK